MDSSIKEEIIKKLDELPVHQVSSNGIQHTVRCPYCGDSNNPAHGHFSIRIDTSDPLDPMLYRCLKCPVSGILTAQVLDDLQIDVSNDIRMGLSKLTEASCRVNKITALKMESFTIPDPGDSFDTQKKLQYINDRIGTNITADEATSKGIILNMYRFAGFNQIMSFYMGKEISGSMRDFLFDHYVGFLGKNKNVITMRYIQDMNPEYFTGKRYIKLKIHPKNLDPNSYYGLPDKIDILYTHKINIHIAEGPLDILSIYYNLQHYDGDNFYYAICGFGYNTILSNIIKFGLNTGIVLHMYADNDKKDDDIIKPIKKNHLDMWCDKIFIHRNALYKDFGVNPSLIKDTIRRVK